MIFPFDCQAMHTTPQQALVTVVVECTLHCTDHPGAADWLLLGTALACFSLSPGLKPPQTVKQTEPTVTL